MGVHNGSPVQDDGCEAFASDSDLLTLVDRDDNPTGVAPKLRVHRAALLHRAFSVFVHNSAGDALLQRRAHSKYHSGGLWSNTCCGHPRPGTSVHAEALRRLREEMGFECELHYVGSTYYLLELPNQMFEHEVDHLFVGQFDGRVSPNPEEVAEIGWMSAAHLRDAVHAAPDMYTPWLKVILAQFEICSHMTSARTGSRMPAGLP